MYLPTDNLKTFMEQNPETYKGIFPEEPPKRMHSALQDIARLGDNWNHNGAKSFSQDLLDKCQNLLKDFCVTPSIFPTATGAIQMEWINNGDYLEFSIFENKCEVFKMFKDGQSCKQETDEKELKNILQGFFEKP